MKMDDIRTLAREVEIPAGEDPERYLKQRMRLLGYDPENIYQELEMSSRFVDTHRDVSFSNDHIRLHSHSFCEVICCCSGCGAEYLVGSERYRLQTGDILFLPPEVSHRPLLPKNMPEPYSRYVLWLSPRFMELYADLMPYPVTGDRPGMLRTAGTPWEDLGERFLAGVRESERREDGWEAAVVGNTLLLLTQIKRATNARSAGRLRAEEPELLDRIRAYVEREYSKAFTIGDLSRRFYVSESTISHLFRQKLGISLHRYVTQRRLIAAKALIAQGQDLRSVAAATGFGDYSSFYRAFRQAFGISPRQYRSLLEPSKIL